MRLLVTATITLTILVLYQEINNVTSSPSNNSTTSSDFEDRINLNFNHGHAHATNPGGGSSVSDTSSYGYNAGILYPGGKYRPIGSQTNSKSNSYSYGRKPPLTYANGGVQSSPNRIQGNAQAGFSGGRGNAYANSHSQQLAIPLGFGGAVVLSNLRPLNESTNTSDIESNVEPLRTPPNVPLVFV